MEVNPSKSKNFNKFLIYVAMEKIEKKVVNQVSSERFAKVGCRNYSNKELSS